MQTTQRDVGTPYARHARDPGLPRLACSIRTLTHEGNSFTPLPCPQNYSLGTTICADTGAQNVSPGPR
jgi:hypothetical protein